VDNYLALTKDARLCGKSRFIPRQLGSKHRYEDGNRELQPPRCARLAKPEEFAKAASLLPEESRESPNRAYRPSGIQQDCAGSTR
jgi:hypothetical protein